jgi:hypothetical protein
MRSRTFVVVASMLSVLSATLSTAAEPQPTNGTSNAVQALAFDVASHPNAEAADIYKFLHQAIFGPGHAIAGADGVAENLETEIDHLSPASAGETWCDTLGGNPLLLRVNLRPFVANGFDRRLLAESFVATANAVHGDPQQMGVALELVSKWLSGDGKQDLAKTLEKLAREMEQKGYPPVHHSAAYVHAYQPAYRVIEASMASARGWCG